MNHTDYYNRKGWYSMLVQAIVDHNYLFRDLCIGWPGSVHDARALANEVHVQGQSLRIFLIGDSAYSTSMADKTFLFSSSLNPQQKRYNYRLSQARVVVEIAFGRLKARWRRLAKQIYMHIDNVPFIVAACCVLDNVIASMKSGYTKIWINLILFPPHQCHHQEQEVLKCKQCLWTISVKSHEIFFSYNT